MRAQLGRIIVYPIKSMDGAALDEARITPGGILEHDRVYSIVDAQGRILNGKRDPRVHKLRCRYANSFQEVFFSVEGSADEGRFILAEPEPLNRWLSGYFGTAVELKAEPLSGFPDDREAFGPTVVSEASLREVAGWYPDLPVESVRRRFRANLEIVGEGIPPFWEDGLYGAPGELRPFNVGPVHILGHNPCQRCVVPTRDPDTGIPITGFQKEFMERRRQTLPPWANASRFNHFYRFAVNTSIAPAEAGKILRVGDSVGLG
jgi:uncharacterized protein YcbX